MSWYWLAALAGLASAVNVATAKSLVAGRLHPALVGGVVHLLGGALCLAALPLTATKLTLTAPALLGLALMGLIYTLGNLLYFSALASTQLSEIDLLLRTSSLWTFLGGVALLREPSGRGVLLGALLITLSVLLLADRRGPFRFGRGPRLALAAALAFGAGNLADKVVSPWFDPLSYTTINLLLTGVGMLALAPQRWRQLGRGALWGARAWTVGLTFALTQWLIILAFTAGGSAGQVILVAQLRMVLLMVVGIVLLGEKDRLGRKVAAALLMIAGLFSLYAARPALG